MLLQQRLCLLCLCLLCLPLNDDAVTHRLFWYQVLTCVSVRLRAAARSMRSCTLRYFCRSKLLSSWLSWWSVKAVRALRGFFVRIGGLSLLLEISRSPSSFKCPKLHLLSLSIQSPLKQPKITPRRCVLSLHASSQTFPNSYKYFAPSDVLTHTYTHTHTCGTKAKAIKANVCVFVT